MPAADRCWLPSHFGLEFPSGFVCSPLVAFRLVGRWAVSAWTDHLLRVSVSLFRCCGLPALLPERASAAAETQHTRPTKRRQHLPHSGAVSVPVSTQLGNAAQTKQNRTEPNQISTSMLVARSALQAVRRSTTSASATAAARSFHASTATEMKVAVLGANGGIGQPLSLLLKLSPEVDELSCYDIVGTPGVAADLSHVSDYRLVSQTCID